MRLYKNKDCVIPEKVQLNSKKGSHDVTHNASCPKERTWEEAAGEVAPAGALFGAGSFTFACLFVEDDAYAPRSTIWPRMALPALYTPFWGI